MKTPFIPMICASALTLSACSDPEALSGEKTRNGALTGAVVGALAGVVAGDDAEAKRRGAVAGAVIGATIGGGIGYNLDQQAKELDRDLDGRIDVVNTGSELVVTMPQDILFGVDSAALRPDLTADLSTLAGSLNKYPESTVNVIGHTDNTGSADYNQGLSLRRAQAVAVVLSNSGVSSSRMRAIGAGEDQPIASNQTESGRAQNRRVEIIIRPN
ncbi:OmpA family protein [Alphaproteobacteria bacterium KMM 3653]|uniref:OmpA family protein n=2 Tax=Harenicola maris TaxID=2841044 RepID=A0AAP2CVI6_9RHOB|nr:OmpA family protein [Harenicola maris]